MAHFPQTVRAVAYRGKMTADGYQPENHAWRDQLCDRDEHGRLIGKDPLSIPLDVLNSAGHPYPRHRGVADVVSRLKVMHGVAGKREGADIGLPFPEPFRFTNIRDFCIECSSGHLAEVRRCAVYDCPAWPFRMGKNPHNPQRGKVPAALAAMRDGAG